MKVAYPPLSDGDKGDIVVSNGGGTWTIDTNAVTYGQLQQTSAASVLLGRGQGSGAGNVQEITLGSGLSLTGTVLSSTGGTGTDPAPRAWWGA